MRFLKIIAAALIMSISVLPAHAQEVKHDVVVLHASSVVLPTMRSYIERGLTDADARDAEAVVIVLDTPGGSVDTTLGIIQDIRTSDVPVIVYVGPRGASAGSAGLFITLAGHAAAMAPESAIGASSPIGSDGADLPDTAEAKAIEFLSAQARSLAERRGEDAVELADAAVKEARAVSGQEALNAGLIDFLAEDVEDVLNQADGMTVIVNGRERVLNTAGAPIIEIEMNILERILTQLSHPNIVALMLAFGPLLIIIEIRTPGGWVAGAVGTVMTALGLYGLGVLPVNWLGTVFIGLALALFILEVKAPVHGLLTAVGATSLAVGLIVLFSEPELIPFGQISIPMVIGQSLIVAAIFFAFAMMGLRAQRLRPTTGYDALIGEVGRVTQDLDPSGMVLVFGERWRAASVDGKRIDTGMTVEVVAAERMRLIVKKVNPLKDTIV